MGIYEHTRHFAGSTIADWEPETAIDQPVGTAYRIGLSYDDRETWIDRFDAFLGSPAAAEATALVIGAWDLEGGSESSQEVVEAVVGARDRLPNLRAIFLGDITSEESEISWITQSDVSPLFAAFPNLEHFCVRGANGLGLGSLRHDRLKSLVIQSGGLDGEIVREVAAARLPSLEHLELWLGDDSYGGNATLEDLAPILAGDRFPSLRYLGLRDSDRADEVAAAVAAAPVLERIRILDLSLGTLTDAGGQALLDSPALARLEFLDLHHHFLSDEMIAKLRTSCLSIDASQRQEPSVHGDEVYRYVAVSE